MENNKRKKNLRYNINNLSRTEHQEIFKIFKKNNYSFTQNKNGVFVDISLLDEDKLSELEKVVAFCMNNKVELDIYDKRINEYKLTNNFNLTNGNVKSNGNNTMSDNACVSKPLDSVIKSAIEDDWQGLLQVTKKNEKIQSFVNLLESNNDKFCLKRSNTQFLNAKKKFSKKMTSDKKNDYDLQNNLVEENYIKIE
jgi:hypothetical protein